MKLTAREIASLTGGTVSGDEAKTVTGLAPLENAGTDDLSFLSDQKYLKFLSDSRAGILILKKGMEVNGRTTVMVDDPQMAVTKLLELIVREKAPQSRDIHPSAVIAKDAKLGKNVAVGPHAVVESGAHISDGVTIGAQCYVGRKVKIGENALLHPQVTLREEVELGKNVIIHSGAVIGSDGFGYATRGGVHHKIPQVGIVVLGDNVEIGANTSIDRATIGKTVIGAGAKIDNLVHIAHNVQVGEGSIILAHVAIAGSTKLGKYVTLAGQVGVVGHITIGDQAIAASQSGIPNDVPAKAVVFGSPARPIADERRIQVIIGKLPEIYSDFKKIKKKVLPEQE